MRNIRDSLEVEGSKRSILIKIALLSVALVGIYHSTFVWIWGGWFGSDSLYSHGILIPLISAFLIWRKRNELMEVEVDFMERKGIDFRIEREISRRGIYLVFIALVMHILALITKFESVSALSLPVMLAGTTMYLLGMEALKILFFPILFLVLMIPAPWQITDPITFRMQLVGTRIATEFLEFLGIANVREGSVVYLLKGVVTIGRPCSGMRSLISLLTLSILYAYLIKGSIFRKIRVVILSIPIAFAVNVIRITTTLLIANSFGVNIAVNVLVHEAFGLAVFILAAGLLYLFDQSMEDEDLPDADLETLN